jgi:predicted ATPase
LIRLAGVQAAEFTEANYEARKASLEAAANQLTDEVFEYWSQNKDLSIELDVDFRSAADQYGQPPFLDIRVRNQRHRVTLNFGERSHGFMWFFSFLAAFSEYRGKQNMILLLDEPGLGLHAAAQADLLRFIDERLAKGHQVIYSTHSPFMVEANRLERVRTVEDVGHAGTKVSADVLSTSRDTRFPLQAALGYDLAQTLFLGPDNLVVEGPADYLYLQVMSGHLRSLGREPLDPRWVIVPVGGLDKIPTFVALLGAQLNVAVVLEVSSGATQKIDSLVRRGIIGGEKLIPLTEITETAEADIEDLFDPKFYLDLLEQSQTASVKGKDLKGAGRILKRIEAAIGASFDHYQPARYLLEHQVELLKRIDDGSVNRFEELFKRANRLLAQQGHASAGASRCS